MKTILVVDDEIILREYLTELLELEDYRAIGVSTGNEAMAEVKKQVPDMVICDMFLNGETGLDLLRRIKREGLEKIPFLFMSAEITPEIREKSEQEGARAFIKKPYENQLLLETVRACF